MRLRVKILAPVLALSLPVAGLIGETQPNDAQNQRALLHQSEQWTQQIQPHLPNPDTASAASLETAGDVLRARRFPEDALDFYTYALAKGGDLAVLKNKIGVVQLDLHRNMPARTSFLEALKANKDYAPAWNNLGVIESLSRNYSHAVRNYQHAAKLDSITATYHANAGMAYFQMKSIDDARRELVAAIQIDPEVLQKHSETGVNAQMLDRDHYGEFCFEMAELFAGQKDFAQMKLWLSKANGSGFDVRGAMRLDAAMSPYLKDPEVKLILSGPPSAHRQAVSGVPGGSTPMQRDFN